MNTYQYPGQETKRSVRTPSNRATRALRNRMLRSRRHKERQRAKLLLAKMEE